MIPKLIETTGNYNHPSKKQFPRIVPKSVFLQSAGIADVQGYHRYVKGNKARRLLEELKTTDKSQKSKRAKIYKRFRKELAQYEQPTGMKPPKRKKVA